MLTRNGYECCLIFGYPLKSVFVASCSNFVVLCVEKCFIKGFNVFFPRCTLPYGIAIPMMKMILNFPAEIISISVRKYRTVIGGLPR